MKMFYKALGGTMSTSENNEVKVEKLTLEDGRHAERRTSVDHQGNEVIEIYAEEVKPLKLEKRIVREMKTVVARELHQTLENGQISTEEVVAVDGLQNPVAVTKDDVAKMIQQAVESVLEKKSHCDNAKPKMISQVLNAQEIVEKNVEEKNKNNNMINIVLGVIIVAQVLFFLGYMLLT